MKILKNRKTVKNIKKKLLPFFLVFCVLFQANLYSPHLYAQGTEGVDEVKQVSGPRRQLATIIFAGLAGAILGLSTLSFYGRPQEKLSNIAVGFAIGIIVGASYTTYKTATDPYEYLNYRPSPTLKSKNLALNNIKKPALSLGYQWHF